MNIFIGSSSRVNDSKYLKLADDISNKLACKYDLVCGGVSSSMMKVIFDNFKKNNKKTTCVTLELYNEDLSVVDQKYLVNNTIDRLNKIYEISDILLILPGGTGTLAELFGLLEEVRTIDKNKKLYLYNYEGYYDFIKEFINNSIKNNFNSEDILGYINFINDIDEII